MGLPRLFDSESINLVKMNEVSSKLFYSTVFSLYCLGVRMALGKCHRLSYCSSSSEMDGSDTLGLAEIAAIMRRPLCKYVYHFF